MDDHGLELPRQSAERVKGRAVQRFGQNGKPVEAGPRIVDVRQPRQHPPATWTGDVDLTGRFDPYIGCSCARLLVFLAVHRHSSPAMEGNGG